MSFQIKTALKILLENVNFKPHQDVKAYQQSKRTLLLISSLLLLGCSSNGSYERTFVAAQQAIFTPLQGPRFVSKQSHSDVNYAADSRTDSALRTLESTPQHGLILRYKTHEAQLTRSQQNNDFVQYESGEIDLTLRDGILVRLRGIGDEFEALYTPTSPTHPRDALVENIEQIGQTRKLLIAHERIMEFWLAQQPVRQRFLCRFQLEAPIAVNTQTALQTVSEHCESIYDETQFINHYHFNQSRQLMESQQWFHPNSPPIYIIHHAQLF